MNFGFYLCSSIWTEGYRTFALTIPETQHTDLKHNT